MRMAFMAWLGRALATGAILLVSACAAGAAPQATARPNEVQVLEPAGQPDRWGYAPRELSVPTGTTVSFVNRGKEFHTVTSDDPGRPFDIGVDSGETKTITFDHAGVFAYHCGIHPQMQGVVRVCDGGCG